MREIITLIENWTAQTAPQPSQADLMDAIEHADHSQHGWDLSDFDLKYEGFLSVEEIRSFDSLDWLDCDDDDDLTNFRGGNFASNGKKLAKNPIVIITAPDEGFLNTQIGDGRGRVNYANVHDCNLHVWHLIWKKHI